MRITIDARELRTSTGRYVERLLHYLQKIDNTNDYVVLLKPVDFDGWIPTNPRFTKLECPYKEFTFSEQLGYFKQLRSLKSDLVFFPITQQPVLYRGKVVTTIQDLTTLRYQNPKTNPVVFKTKQFVYSIVVRYVAHRSKALITPTDFVKHDVASYTGVKPEKITVTLEAADPISEAAQPISSLKDKQFIMYIGRALPHKNLRRLIDAFTLIQKNHPNLKLVLAGKKDELYEKHAAAAKQKGIKGIVFTGFVSEGELRWLYQNTQVYIFPSLSEGFGLPGLEAALCGAPVVASNATCLPEVYGSGAYYFDPYDAQDMADKIGHILDDPKLRTKFIEAGKKQASKYSWERMARQTLEVFERVLKS